MSAGEWIEHDGSGPPNLPHGADVDVVFFKGDGRLIEPTDPLPFDWPGWTWRVRRVRVNWFRFELREVCDLPGFAPILREIAANPPERILEDA